MNYTRSIKLILLFISLGFVWLSLAPRQRSVHAYSGGPDPSVTGAPAFGATPAEPNCSSTVGCHTGNPLNDANNGASFRILDVPSGYNPGQNYTIRVNLTRSSRARYGFQITALDENGKMAGTLTATDTTRTQKMTGTIGSGGSASDREYIEHTFDGTSPSSTGMNEWSFRWTAPSTRIGKITFYAAGNAANGASQVGDFIYTTSSVSRPSVVTVSGASFDQTSTVVTNNSIASAFGVDLATSTTSASGDADPGTPGIQLPTTLGGTTVKVRDSLNVERDATLFFVSPLQVNYLLPNSMAPGTATVTFTSGNGTISTGTVTVAAVKPGIFTVNQAGSGYAAAQIQRINGTTVSFEDVATGPVGNPTAIPIEWKNGTELIFLTLYGTGFRQRSQVSNVMATIKGATQAVDAALAHPDFAGLDQVNVLLNRNLAGSGNVTVVLTVDGVTSNTVQINVK